MQLSYQSLDRHTRNCVPKALALRHPIDSPPPQQPERPLTVREAADAAATQRDCAFADSLMTEVELLHKTTMDLLRESRERSLQVEGRAQKSLAGHRRILAAIKRRDAEAAKDAMRHHIEDVEEIVLNKVY